jgi:hypothetical protein
MMLKGTHHSNRYALTWTKKPGKWMTIVRWFSMYLGFIIEQLIEQPLTGMPLKKRRAQSKVSDDYAKTIRSGKSCQNLAAARTKNYKLQKRTCFVSKDLDALKLSKKVKK